jgi:hypothetical protein
MKGTLCSSVKICFFTGERLKISSFGLSLSAFSSSSDKRLCLIAQLTKRDAGEIVKSHPFRSKPGIVSGKMHSRVSAVQAVEELEHGALDTGPERLQSQKIRCKRTNLPGLHSSTANLHVSCTMVSNSAL